MSFNLSRTFLLTLLICYSFHLQAVEIDDMHLPDMGDSSGTLISPIQEQALGRAFFRSLHRRVKINQDSEIQEYIQSIGKQLVANSDLPSYPFHFFLVLDQQINAFAGPGGYIGINSGLLLLTDSESELTSVISHEIAHVTQRHLYRAFEAASRLSIPTAAATLAAILLGTQSPAMGQAAIMAIQAGSIQYQINFTRANEQEADRIGMKILAKSNFNPRSMADFFEKLQVSSRYYGRNIPEFLRTHPVSSDRISDTRGRSNQYPYKQYPDTSHYLLTKAKVKVMTTADKTLALDYFKQRQDRGTLLQQAVTQYGMGLAHLELRHFDQAEKIFRRLHRHYPEQSQYLYAIAKTALTAQQYKKALALFSQAIHHFPFNNAIKIDYISALIRAGQPEKAKIILQSLDEQIKNLPLYFKRLSEVYAGLKQPAESHRYLAEYYYVTGQTQSAILQIRLAQKAEGMNFYLQAILAERLKFFLDEEKQRQLDR